jgi:hypothetical protein
VSVIYWSQLIRTLTHNVHSFSVCWQCLHIPLGCASSESGAMMISHRIFFVRCRSSSKSQLAGNFTKARTMFGTHTLITCSSRLSSPILIHILPLFRFPLLLVPCARPCSRLVSSRFIYLSANRLAWTGLCDFILDTTRSWIGVGRAPVTQVGKSRGGHLDRLVGISPRTFAVPVSLLSLR